MRNERIAGVGWSHVLLEAGLPLGLGKVAGALSPWGVTISKATAPQQILSLAVFSALPRLRKVQDTPLWVPVVYGFAFLFCCALIGSESNSDLVELSATPLFSKNFHWHQEIFFLSCCHWTEADVIMLRTSEHSVPCVCVWGLEWAQNQSQDICWNLVLYCLRSVTKSWVAAKSLDWHQRKKRIYWGYPFSSQVSLAMPHLFQVLMEWQCKIKTFLLPLSLWFFKLYFLSWEQSERSFQLPF